MSNFPCVFCNDSFDEVRYYKRHLEKHHVNNEKYDQSKVQDELVKLSKSKKDHKKFVCDECKKGYSTKSLLQRHECTMSFDHITKILDAKITNYELAVKVRDYAYKLVDKYAPTTKEAIHLLFKKSESISIKQFLNSEAYKNWLNDLDRTQPDCEVYLRLDEAYDEWIKEPAPHRHLD